MTTTTVAFLGYDRDNDPVCRLSNGRVLRAFSREEALRYDDMSRNGATILGYSLEGYLAKWGPLTEEPS